MTTRQRVVRALMTVVLVAPVLTGCALVPGVGCGSPDETVVEELMSHAKTDFAYGDSQIARLGFEDAGQGELPEELQRYGATDIVVIYAVSYFANPVADELSGVYGINAFVVDEDGHPVGPVSSSARDQFDLPVPDESGWDEWADRVFKSPEAIDVRSCVRK